MPETYIDPNANGLLPEFLPTEVRFFAIANTKALKGLVARMAAISVKSAITPGTDLIQLDTVAPTAVTEGFLKLYTTNGSIFMRSRLHGISTNGDSSLLIPAERLSAVLSQAKGETVTLSCIGFELQVSSGNSLWRIQIPSHAEIPNLSTTDGTMVAFDVEELRRVLSGVVKAAADGLSRVSLTQARLGKGYAISCDGARMHRVHSDDLEGVENFTITTLGVKLFLALLKTLPSQSEVVLSFNDLSASLNTSDEEVTILRAQVPFPDVEKVFISQSVMNDTTLVVPRKELQDAVTQVKIFADEVLSGVSLTSSVKAGDKQVLLVHAKDDIGNFSSTELQVTVTGKAVVDLRLNYKHLQDALNSVDSDIVTIRVAKNSKSGKSSAFIEDIETGFVAVIGQIIKEK